MRSPFEFTKQGNNGHEVSEIFPNVGRMIDDFCQVRSMVTDIPNHGPSVLMMNTGSSRFGMPSMGSWIAYGLGSENQNLPGFVVLAPNAAGDGGVSRWGAGFLPAIYQGTLVPTGEIDPRKQIQHSANAKLTAAETAAATRPDREVEPLTGRRGSGAGGGHSVDGDRVSHADRGAGRVRHSQRERGDLEAYNVSEFGRACLMARRLVERGVRMVQLYHAPWDHHADVMGHKLSAAQVDQPIAVLVQDLRNRGLLKDTLVVVGTEFGRTPVVNLGGFRSVHNGRDHNIFGFTVLLAGARGEAGIAYGKTDDFGFKVVENPVHVHDLQATILHLLGLDHERLTYRYNGRDFRLTDVEGKVVKDILA